MVWMVFMVSHTSGEINTSWTFPLSCSSLLPSQSPLYPNLPDVDALSLGWWSEGIAWRTAAAASA